MQLISHFYDVCCLHCKQQRESIFHPICRSCIEHLEFNPKLIHDNSTKSVQCFEAYGPILTIYKHYNMIASTSLNIALASYLYLAIEHLGLSVSSVYAEKRWLIQDHNRYKIAKELAHLLSVQLVSNREKNNQAWQFSWAKKQSSQANNTIYLF